MIRKLKGTNRGTGHCKLSVEGDMTIYQALALKEELSSYQEEYRDLQLDLSAVAEFDSAGFQLLLMLNRASQDGEKRFQILRCSDTVKEVLQLFHMENHFGADTDNLESI